mmetsp:Transcript_17108/g.30720  ORF Transcript_17108/g.30720 Transcript_17108/m.30720 type:complete len:213 (+) Transcript_17108:238-876(+)
MVNVTKHRTCLLSVCAVLVNVRAQFRHLVRHVHRNLLHTLGGRIGSGFLLGIVPTILLRLRLNRLRDLHHNRIVTVVQVLHAQFAQHGGVRGTLHAVVVILEDGEELHELDLVAQAHDVVDGVGGDALEGLVVFLVEAGEEEGERAGDADGLELFGGHLGLAFFAEAFHALVLGFDFARVRIDQLLLGSHGAHGPVHTSGHLHLSSLILRSH